MCVCVCICDLDLEEMSTRDIGGERYHCKSAIAQVKMPSQLFRDGHKPVVSIGEEKIFRIRALPTVQNVDRRRKRSRYKFTLGKLTG